jgi:hypothetical protein
MRLAVFEVSYWRRHVDDSFDPFSLLQIGHRVVAALELLAREVIAVLEFRNRISRVFAGLELSRRGHTELSACRQVCRTLMILQPFRPLFFGEKKRPAGSEGADGP